MAAPKTPLPQERAFRSGVFKLGSKHTTKTAAKKRAESLKNQGKNVRVRSKGKDWGVYVRG